MATNIYDRNDDLPVAGATAVIELAGSEVDTTFIGVTVADAAKIGLKAANSQRIFISTAGVVSGTGRALELNGSANRVYNEGMINQGFVEGTSPASTGIAFIGGGLNEVTNRGTIKGTRGVEIINPTVDSQKLDLFNSGTIATSDLAVRGGIGTDRIVNTGTISTSGAVLMDLGDGNDFYDGAQGTAIGVIKLGQGNDTAYGGSGSETFVGGTGTNSIDGGSGTADTIDYSEAVSGVAVNLALTGSQTIIAQTTGTIGTSDTLLNLEHVIGSAFGDALTGNGFNNSLTGGLGDDTLDGSFGDDTLNGGGGSDTAKFSGFVAATVDLSSSLAQTTVYGTDLYIGIEHLVGGSGADRFTGSDDANQLTGGGGNDTLRGGKGDDTLDGGAGADTAEFSGSSDEYTWTAIDGGFKMVDKQGGRDGEDVLKDIRFAKFADGTTVALTNGSPTFINPASVTLAESKAFDATVATLSATIRTAIPSPTASFRTRAGCLA
jgi:serralysin